jgi:ABC-2 type transport system permease protein
MRRIGLIAGREISAYASVPSFWVALLIGPVLMVLVGLASSAASLRPGPAPIIVAIETSDPQLRDLATRSLADAGALTGRPTTVLEAGSSQGAQSRLTIESGAAGGVSVRVQGAPLSPTARALIERDLATPSPGQARLRAVAIEYAPEATAAAPTDQARISRYVLSGLLWLNLVGSLGMLLQAVVRERANRALETLLSAARPSEIVLGKLAGVGALSVLVLAVWLGSGALIAGSPLGGAGQGMGEVLLSAFASPGYLLLAGLVYILAFAMYGAALIGLGAMAADLPSAQNLSRPVFGVLLIIFFLSLGQMTGLGGAGGSWLLWAPPMTPFVLLTMSADALGPMQLAAALAMMAAVAAMTCWLAGAVLQGASLRIRRRGKTSVGQAPGASLA